MSKAPSVGTNGAPVQGKHGLLPPEEKFWKRYSPHHEAPLSGFTSFMLHVSIVGIVALAAFWLNRSMKEREQPLPVTPIEIGEAGGGGGNPNAGEENDVKANRKETATDTPTEQRNPIAVLPKEKLTDVKPDPLESKDFRADDGRLIADASEQLQKLDRMDKDLRQKLMEGLASKEQRSKGVDGSGTGGGKDKGHGAGDGDGSGPGSGTISTRQKRVLRWSLMFNTSNGDDYRKQLAGLGAILAIPSGAGEYRIIRNLNQTPVDGSVEDVSKINRIFWVDDKQDSVRDLATALGLRPIPPHIVAFFPVDLEKELLQKEAAYKGRKENQIQETRFDVVRRGGGYSVVVRGQTPAPVKR